MKCGNCGNDLMLGIVPKGPAKLLRFLPMTSYTCVRCGKSNWRLSDAYGALGSRLAVALVCLAALAGAYVLGALYGLPGEGMNAVRVAVTETAPRPDAPPSAPLPQPEPVTQPTEPVTQPAEPTAQPSETATATAPAQEQPAMEASSDTSAPAAAPAPAPMPTAPGQPPVIAPKAAPGAAAATDAAPPAASGSSDLEEVVVTPSAPAVTGKPTVVGGNKAARGRSSKWSTRVGEVTVEESGGGATVVLKANSTLDAPNSFSLQGPPRFVVDIPGTWTKDSPRTLEASAGPVKGVRLGLHGDKLRLVLDLAKLPAKAPTVSVQGDVLTITVR